MGKMVSPSFLSYTINSVFIIFTAGQSFWSYVPLSCKNNDVSSFSQSPLIGHLSNLQVTMRDIKARMSSNLGLIGLFTLELFALEPENFFP